MKKLIALFIILSVYSCKDESKLPEEEFLIEELDSITNQQILAEIPEPIIEKTIAEIKTELTEKGYQTFEYVDAKTQDTILMQQYYIAFLKSGPIRSQNEEEAASLQEQHLAHLSRMYEEGFADLIGPFGDDGDIRGIAVYNVPTLKMADSLANLDPMVKAGRLVIEVHPWWSAKGQSLR
jgi:uncharacterized protein YciI